MIGIEWAWAIPALSASAFVVVALFGRWLPMRGAFVSVAAILLGFVLFWFVLIDLLQSGGGTFSAGWLVLGDVSITWGVIVDRLSVTMIGLVTFVALLVQVYSIEYMRGEPRYGWYFASHALFAAAMLALVLADNLVFLYLAWELVGLGSYLLIGFWHEKRPAAEAAKKAFVTTRIGDVGLLIGIILLYRATGTFDISGVIHAVENGVGTGLISQGTVNLAMFLVFLGAMGKSAQFPFHVWLPGRHGGPDARERADPRRHDGGRGRIPGRPADAAVRDGAGRAAVRCRDRTDHVRLRGHPGAGDDRPEARPRLLDD